MGGLHDIETQWEIISNSHYIATALPLSLILCLCRLWILKCFNDNSYFVSYIGTTSTVFTHKKPFTLAEQKTYKYKRKGYIIFTHSRDTAYNPHYKVPQRQETLLL
jgi:hypothetical protein